MSDRPQRWLFGRAPAVVLLLSTLLVALLQPLRAEAAPDSADPLTVTISQLDTATLVAGKGAGKGKVEMSGTVTNTTKDTWSGVKIFPCLGKTPITTEQRLAEEAARPATDVVCERIVRQGANVALPDLGPHKSYAWHLSIPRRLITTEIHDPGVYWFGVHALGSQSPSVADGRARTFLPLIGQKAAQKAPEKVALVLPLRRQVTYHSDGRVAYVQGWTRDLEGRLSSLLEIGRRLPDATWAVDPALLDAVRKLAAGNPPRNLRPTDGTGEPKASESPSPPALDASPAAGSDDDAEHQEDRRISAEAKHAASAWLEQLDTVLSGRDVLALPYGDPDIPALAASDRALYATAREQAAATFKSLGIDVEPGSAAPSGYLDAHAVKLLSPDSVNLVGDDMFKGAAPAVAAVEGRNLIVTSSAAASGGPGPGDRTDNVSMRQRILSQAALRRAAGGKPLIVLLPDTWKVPATATDFTDALDTAPWIRPTSVADAIDGQAAQDVPATRLLYPHQERKAQISATRLATANDLIRSGRTLQRVLTHNSTVSAQVINEALTTTSYASRGHDTGAAPQALDVIDSGLRQITVTGPPAVILSSTKGGKFQVTVHNDLPETVTVRLAGVSEGGRVRVNRTAPIQIDAHSRTTWQVPASMADPGTHDVTILVTDTQGTPLGGQLTLQMRSAQVSSVIWWFVGTGCALLFAAVAVRLVRRVMGAQRAKPRT